MFAKTISNLVVILRFWLTPVIANDNYEFNITMPYVHPTKPDQYMTYMQQFWNNDTYHIVSFLPLATMDTVHHMILSGCEEAFEGGCKKQVLLYAWARNAPRLDLPEGVGFKVGLNSTIKYFHLQVHYANISKFQDGSRDHSGLSLIVTTASLHKEAGTLILMTGGEMEHNSTEYFEVACPYTANVDIHAFAFRTHTHTHGLLVSGYKVHKELNGTDTWKLIGKKNPQLPQFFYPSNDVVIHKGDILAARCTMMNVGDSTISIGSSSTNEMCNFYIMYYKEQQTSAVVTDTCYSRGPPSYHWNTDPLLNNIPEDASSATPTTSI